MKLVHPDLESQIILEIDVMSVWIIESPALFMRYVQELYFQTEGVEGHFILSEDTIEQGISKSMEVIVNPFSVDINDRKILGKLYSRLSEMAFQEEMYMQTQEIMTVLQNYFFSLEYLSPHMLEADLEVDISSILRAMGVKFANSADGIFENINQYIKIIAELLRKRVLVLVNARSYFDEKQLEELRKNAIYNEVALLLIENQQKSFSKPIKQYIIDEDGCEIF